MSRRTISDYDWSWWPGDPDHAPPPQEDDEEGRADFLEEQPTALLPRKATIVDELPAPRSARRSEAARRRRLARLAAPILMLILVAAAVVVLLLPDASTHVRINSSCSWDYRSVAFKPGFRLPHITASSFLFKISCSTPFFPFTKLQVLMNSVSGAARDQSSLSRKG